MLTISISEDVLQSLPQGVKDALLLEIQRRVQGTAAVAAPTGEGQDVVDGNEPADLSLAQAPRYLEGCSDKTKRVLRAIVVEGREFRLSALAQSLNLSFDALGGVWGGLTKRTRTILGDKNARLIIWRKNFYDAQDTWQDAAGEMSEETYRSLRKALEV